MDDQKFEQVLGRLLNQDLSVGTEEFRDALLERCLDQIDSNDNIITLKDTDLDQLAAAGERIPVDPDSAPDNGDA